MQPLPSVPASPSALPPPPAAPARHEPAPRGGAGKYLTILGLVVVAGLAWWLWQKQLSQQADAERAAAAIRTHTVAGGRVERSMRLTGVTAAEKFVSLIAPQLRGGRSDRGRGGSSSSLASVSLPSLGGGARASSSSGGSSSSTVASSGSGGAGGGAAAGDGSAAPSSTGDSASAGGGGGGRSGSAMRAATSRTGGGGARSTAGSSGGRIQTGEASLGSTGGQLDNGFGGGGGGGGTPGGGGGRGGGGGDFTLTLQNLAKPGSRVAPNQTVAEFDRQYMMLRLDDYKSSILTYEANMKKLRSEVDLYRVQHAQTIEVAKSDLAKAELDVKTIPVRSNIEAERLRLALEEAKARYNQLLSEVQFVEVSVAAQIKNAELDMKAAQIELGRAQANADRMLVKSPIGGITVMQQTFAGSEFRPVQEGDPLMPGFLFMQVVDTSSMIINATVNQVDAERMRINAKAKVRFDAYPGLELPAHVVSVAAVTKAGGFRATFMKEIPVRLKLDAMDPRVIPDLSVSADVILESEDAPALVPLAALTAAHETNQPAGKRFVFVRETTGWVRREVEIGSGNYVLTAVRSGLKPGEVVALEPPIQTPEPSKT
ncbi:MAG: HlyD family secretion protein [Bryobacteraceae bacterium]|nr:HlyD family secretion protein [Bryobacteraceae bacterium]